MTQGAKPACHNKALKKSNNTGKVMQEGSDEITFKPNDLPPML